MIISGGKWHFLGNRRGISIPVLTLASVFSTLSFQAQAQAVVDNTTLNCKYMFGYQGWQRTSGDGCGQGWAHWASGTPDGNNLLVDVFPDLSEYSAGELTATNMRYSNGSTVGLYSTCNEATVMRHWKWMKDYEVDGAWVQRFSPPHTSLTAHYNKQLLACKKGAETYGRVFTVMWDISSSSNSSILSSIQTDWMYLVDQLNITASPAYLRHNGKPLISIWGYGFSDRSMTPDVGLRLIQWFQSGAAAKYQATVMIGVIAAGAEDWKTKTTWRTAINAADIISPWYVGSYGEAEANNWKTTRMIPDLAECRRIGKEYLPVIWPGFSWANLKNATFNPIPRNGGRFFWKQVYNSISAGSTMLYNAMYDEIDEGTAMFKIASSQAQAPVTGNDYWLTLDADGYTNLPSDWYLRLAGYAKKMMCGGIPLDSVMPIDPRNPNAVNLMESKFESVGENKNKIRLTGRTLRVSKPNQEKTTVSLFRMDGKRNFTMEFTDGTDALALPVSIPDGVYFMKVFMGNKAPISSTLILSHLGGAILQRANNGGTIELSRPYR